MPRTHAAKARAWLDKQARRKAKRGRHKAAKRKRGLAAKMEAGLAPPCPGLLGAVSRVPLVEGSWRKATVVQHAGFFSGGTWVCWIRASDRTRAAAARLLDQTLPLLARTRNARGAGGCSCADKAEEEGGMCPRHLSILQSGTDSTGRPVFVDTASHGNSFIATNNSTLHPIVCETLAGITTEEITSGSHPSQHRHAIEAVRLMRAATVLSSHVFAKDEEHAHVQDLHTDAPTPTPRAQALAAVRGVSDKYSAIMAAGRCPLRLHHGHKGTDTLSASSGYILDMFPGDVMIFCARRVAHSGAYLPSPAHAGQVRVSAALEVGEPSREVCLLHMEELSHKRRDGKHGKATASVGTTARVRLLQQEQAVGWREAHGVARSADWEPVGAAQAAHGADDCLD